MKKIKILLMCLIGLLLLSQMTIANSQVKMEWKTNFSVTTSTLNSVCGGDDKLVTVGNNGVIKVSNDGSVWEGVDSGLALNSKINSVIYDGNDYIAVTSTNGKGKIISSSEGLEWAELNEFKSELKDICYDKNRSMHIAVGANGYIVLGFKGHVYNKTSFNTLEELNLNDGVYLNCITNGNEKYVAAGDKGKIYTSSSGHEWNEQESNVQMDLSDITYNKELNMYVAVGKKGTILTSEDGVTWKTVQLNANSSKYDIKSVSSLGSSGFIACGGNAKSNEFCTLNSSDGVTWGVYILQKGQVLNSVTSFQGKVVAVGDNGCIRIQMTNILSNDKNTSADISTKFTSACWDGEKYVLVGDKGQIVTIKESTDIKEQVGKRYLVNKINCKNKLNYIIYNSYLKEYAIAGDGVVHILKDLSKINNSANILTKSDANFSIYGIAFSNSKYIFVGKDKVSNIKVYDQSKKTWRSKDIKFFRYDSVKKIWKVIPQQSQVFLAVTYKNGKFIATGYSTDTLSGVIYYSTDGINWKNSYQAPKGHSGIRAVSWAGVEYIAVGSKNVGNNGKVQKGAIYKSSDGISWREWDRKIDTGSKLKGIASCFNESVIVGDDGTILELDGSMALEKVKIEQEAFLTNDINCIVSSGKDFLCAGAGGFVMSREIKQPIVYINNVKQEYKNKLVVSDDLFLLLPVKETVEKLGVKGQLSWNSKNKSAILDLGYKTINFKTDNKNIKTIDNVVYCEAKTLINKLDFNGSKWDVAVREYNIETSK